MRQMVRWIAVVAAGELLLLALGGGALAAPHLTDPASWPGWLLARGTDVAVLALVRVAALWAGAYLLAILVVGTVSRAARWGPLIRVGNLVTPSSLRHLLDRAMGMAAASSVAVASFAGAAPPASADGHERPPTSLHGPPITLRGLDGPRPDRAPTTTTTVPLPPTVPAPVAGPPPPAPSAPAEPEPPPPPSGVAPPPTPPPNVAEVHEPPPGEAWTVRRGDSFWVIAQQRLADAWGRAPTAREVDPYWRALIEANRSRLADAGNPDLLFPGQVLDLPPPPARAA